MRIGKILAVALLATALLTASASPGTTAVRAKQMVLEADPGAKDAEEFFLYPSADSCGAWVVYVTGFHCGYDLLEELRGRGYEVTGFLYRFSDPPKDNGALRPPANRVYFQRREPPPGGSPFYTSRIPPLPSRHSSRCFTRRPVMRSSARAYTRSWAA